MKEYELLWKQVLDVIRVSVSTAAFSTWFAHTFIVRNKEITPERQAIEIGCPSPYVRDTLERRYFGIIQDSLQQISGKVNDVVFIVKPKPHTSSSPPDFSPLFHHKEDDEKELASRFTKTGLLPGFTFSNFAVSPSNQLAWAAAAAVAKNSGRAYNPLFVWGGVGVGKTHLASAIGHEILKTSPDIKVLYATGEEFMVGIIDAIRTKTTNEFKKRYRNIDVLVIDDIQFIAGKPTVQDEFFHTFNVIQRAGGQIIVTSDRPPREIPKLADRLKNRFEAGLIVDIAPPDFELRCAIFIIKAKEQGIALSMDTIQLVAMNILSPRELEGFLTRLQSRTVLTNTPITDTLIKELLNVRGKTTQGVTFLLEGDGVVRITPQNVVSTVCMYFSIPKKTIVSPTRTKTIALPRQILMYLLRTELKLPLEEIGKILGGRDHTTILYGVEKINSLLPKSSEVEQHVLGIKKQLWG